MRTILLLSAIACLPACTVATGRDASGASYAYASVGGDSSWLDLSPGRATLATANTSESFRRAANVATAAVITRGLVSATSTVSGAVKSVKNASTSAGVAKDAAANATESQRINADLTKRLAELQPAE